MKKSLIISTLKCSLLVIACLSTVACGTRRVALPANNNLIETEAISDIDHHIGRYYAAKRWKTSKRPLEEYDWADDTGWWTCHRSCTVGDTTRKYRGALKKHYYKDIDYVEVTGFKTASVFAHIFSLYFINPSLGTAGTKVVMKDGSEVDFTGLEGQGAEFFLDTLPLWPLNPGRPYGKAKELAYAFEYMRQVHEAMEDNKPVLAVAARENSEF